MHLLDILGTEETSYIRLDKITPLLVKPLS